MPSLEQSQLQWQYREGQQSFVVETYNEDLFWYASAIHRAYLIERNILTADKSYFPELTGDDHDQTQRIDLQRIKGYSKGCIWFFGACRSDSGSLLLLYPCPTSIY
jgi:hypothetical protein